MTETDKIMLRLIFSISLIALAVVGFCWLSFDPTLSSLLGCFGIWSAVTALE